MEKITEDYVSFETAKLLKEKGFEGYSIITTYDKDAANAYIKELQEKHLPYSSDDPKLKEFYYTMPTLQMAMKWLRKIHKIYMDIPPTHSDDGFIHFIWQTYNSDYLVTGDCDIFYPTYEQACEAAIKYCLENLI